MEMFLYLYLNSKKKRFLIDSVLKIMIETKYRIGLFATIFAIVFTTLIHIWEKYATLWLSLEVIILPLIYYIGYELLMSDQKEELEKELDIFIDEIEGLEDYAVSLEKENSNLKEKLRKK